MLAEKKIDLRMLDANFLTYLDWLVGRWGTQCLHLQHQQQKQQHETCVMQQFLADVSHQIKTPLSNIMVYSELVSGSSNVAQEENSHHIKADWKKH